MWTGFVRTSEKMVAFIPRSVRTNEVDSVLSVEVVIDHFPFEVREQGWGEFEIEVKVEFKNEAELPITFTHFLKLHPFNGEPSQENVVGIALGE